MFLDLPVHLYIIWLCQEAAIKDGDPINTQEKLRLESEIKDIVLPRCPVCGRFVRRDLAMAGLGFCSPEHAALQFERLVNDGSLRKPLLLGIPG